MGGQMNTIKEWLAQNNYEDVLKRINAVERGWKSKGTKTRRDWGEVLAGNKDGSPKMVEGIKFPVICAARKRKGWPAEGKCICRNPTEEMPAIAKQVRWEKCKAHSHNLEKT
jgi:hypothetical protein